MDRLTVKIKGRKKYGVNGDLDSAIIKLASYEDTELTPKEIMEMKAEWCAFKQKQAEVDSIGVYDQEEIVENATVQIWRNSVTGEESIGWWRGTKEDMPVAGERILDG